MIIPPRTLKGFRDFLPAAMNEVERVVDTARRVYRSFGFAPIDTPALEYLEILLGKGSEETDRQLYRFADHGGREVGMRFDLTVPLARFVAQHWSQLGAPFKRYHIAKVWRGENTQHGRYREFTQCDFDTIGSTSLVADAEMIIVVDALMRALGVERFTIRINHRKILTGLLEQAGLTERATDVLRALDKLPKVGAEAVMEEMHRVAGVPSEWAARFLDVAGMHGQPKVLLASLEPLVAESVSGRVGWTDLQQVFSDLEAGGVPEGRCQLDLSIARGLDYYSGMVMETTLDDLPHIGSVCSGGRYDDLASLYTKERLPGVGASLGLDRLLAALEELHAIAPSAATVPVLLVHFDEGLRGRYLQLSARLRRDGIGVELYPEPKRIGTQLKYADARGISLALIIGQREWDSQSCQLKHLPTGESHEISLAGDVLESTIRSLCGPIAR